jgi:tyrosine-protein kinase Etk/Wzc
VYEADGKLLIAQDNMSSIMGSSPLEDIMLSSLGKSDPMSTQMEIIQTRPIMNKVINSLNLKDENGIALDPEVFAKRYKISVLRNTNIIEIKCRYSDQDTAAMFINLVASVYVERNQFMNQEVITTAREFIEEQLISQKAKVDEAEKSLVAFKEVTKTVSLGKETDVNIEALSNIETERIKAESDLNGAMQQQKVYKSKIESPGAQSSPSYSSWVIAADQTDNLIIGLRGKIENVRNQIKRQESAMRDMPVTEVKLAQLMREQQVATEIYMGLLSKYEEYKVQEVAQIGSAKIIEPAIAPLKPILPKKRMTLALSFLLGISIGASILFLKEYLKGLPHSVEEVKTVLGYPVLGVILYGNMKNRRFFTKDNKNGVQSEAIRLIQTNLRFKGVGTEGCKVIVVTSTQPGEGKSTIATNLAYSFSFTYKTLLLGMDLRKPSLNDILGVNLVKGITDLLIDSTDVPETKVDSLSVIGSGTLPPNPLELVQSPKFRTIIDGYKKQYDIIIIDTAPVTVVAETLEIAKIADVVMVVVDISSVSLRNLHNLKSTMTDKQLPVPCLVVNKYGKGSLGGYSAYKTYYTEQRSND